MVSLTKSYKGSARASCVDIAIQIVLSRPERHLPEIVHVVFGISRISGFENASVGVIVKRRILLQHRGGDRGTMIFRDRAPQEQDVVNGAQNSAAAVLEGMYENEAIGTWNAAVMEQWRDRTFLHLLVQ